MVDESAVRNVDVVARSQDIARARWSDMQEVLEAARFAPVRSHADDDSFGVEPAEAAAAAAHPRHDD